MLGEKIRNVKVQDVQLDEIWGFCFKKQKAVQPGADPNFGDVYTFVAIERHSKLVLNFALGKRDQKTTDKFVEGLRLASYGCGGVPTDLGWISGLSQRD